MRVLEARGVREQFHVEAQGITRFGLSLDAVASITVPVPPLAQQRAIADFLDRETAKIDYLVSEKDRLADLLKARIRAEITTLFEEPHSALRIGWIARVGNGATPSREEPDYWFGDIPWLTSGKVHEGVISEADQFVTDLAARENHLPMVAAGSVLLAITGEGKTRGTAAFLTIDCTISQHLAFMTVTDRRVMPRYLCLWLQTQYEALRRASLGGGSTKAALTCEFLRSLRFPVPPVEKQQEIVELSAASRDRNRRVTDVLQKGVKKLRDYRSALITAAVTGQIDVRNPVRTELAATEETQPQKKHRRNTEQQQENP